MDGIHDLGGREGFGPIDVHEPEEPFHHAWEGRMWGIARALTRPPGWTIDWWRHGREQIEPLDYLARPYYDQWMQTYTALLIDSGMLSVAEAASGRARDPLPQPGTPMPPEAVPAAAAARTRYDRPQDTAAAFVTGDRVRATSHGRPGHTRLPAYVRGRRGRIRACRGAQVLPDASARGEQRAEPLYSVVFDAAELWPEAAGRRDRVILELWESYLEPA